MVMAHHRSGSNFFGDVLEAHPALACLNEPFTMHTSVFLPRDLIRWGAADYRSDVLHPDLADMSSAVESIKSLAGYTGLPGRGFKETLGFEKLGWIERVFPGWQVILYVRDPRAVINSVLSRPYMLKKWAYRPLVARYRDMYGGELPFEIAYETPVDQLISSWQVRWYEAQRYIAESRERPGGLNVTLVQFEDLMADPEATLTRVMRSIGFDVHPNQLQFIEDSHNGPSRGGDYSTVRDPQKVLNAWRGKLSAKEISRINWRLRHEMEVLGYE
jgi:hypothetical protein